MLLRGGKNREVKVTRVWLCDPMNYTMEFSREPLPSPKDLPNPGIKPRSPALQVDSLPAEPQGEHKNSGVGSLSLLQGIFLIQESNQGLLHCRQILYQLSYQGGSKNRGKEAKKYKDNRQMKILVMCSIPWALLWNLHLIYSITILLRARQSSQHWLFH